jgi:hypothetical protein
LPPTAYTFGHFDLGRRAATKELRTLLVSGLMLCASLCQAELERPRAVRLLQAEAALRVDGRLDDAVWQRAPVFDAFVQYLPQDKRPVPDGYRTTVQVVVDDTGISFGIRAFDPRPDEIRAPLARRDQVRRDQDFVSAVLDPVGTRRSAQFVRVNAAGVVADGMFIADNDNEDFSPDFEVDAAVQRLPDGYSVEIRLPLLALRYPYSGGKPWRLMVTRSIPRDVSTLLLSAPLTKDALNFIAELQEIDGLSEPGTSVTDAVRDRSFLSVRPELTVRTRRTKATGTSQSESEVSLSADIKWRPRADWVFDATLNPDFSQVELDVPQLAGNTRFALSVPEKRAFFLESTDVLDLPLAAFYSRAVTDPRWGVRATWRGSQADATALSLQDSGGGLILRPGPYGTDVAAQNGRSQASLARGRWHGDSYTVGGVLSQRDYGSERGSGRSNQVAGADLMWRASEQEQFRVRALLSNNRALFDSQGAPVSGTAQSGQHLFASWWKRTPDWNLTAEASHVSPRFRNDNGFVGQAGVRSLQAEAVRRFGETQLPGFTAYEFEAFVWAQQRSALADEADPSIQSGSVRGGEIVTRRVHTGIWWAASRNTEAWVQLRFDSERAGAGLRLHAVPTVASGYSVNPAPWFPRFNTEVEVGQRLDVEADRVGKGAVWMAEIQLRGEFPSFWGAGWGWESTQRVDQGFINANATGRRSLTDTAAQWLGVLHFDARNSLRAVWQGTHYRRTADAQAGLTAYASQSHTASLVFQHRFGLGRSLSLGASRQTVRPGQEESTEAFAKLSYELDR